VTTWTRRSCSTPGSERRGAAGTVPGYIRGVPQVTAEAPVPVDHATAFAVSRTTGRIGLRWDPFIRACEGPEVLAAVRAAD